MQYAAAYIRVSTDDQVEYSPDAQLRAIKSYCVKNDLYLDPAYIFVDEGYSGRKAEKRPAFMRMIGTAKKKPAPFEIILVHKFDRFARNREDSVVYKSLLNKQCGVKVVSITESIENDKMGLIMESMLEAMAEYYSINLSEEVKKGMTEKARRGEPNTIAPFGYRMKNKKLVIVPEEAEVIRQIFSNFIAGKAYFAISRECNEAGIRTHRGGLFENRTVDYIIHNPVYAGFVRWTPTKKIRRDFSNPESLIVKGEHEAIIDMATYSAAQKHAEELKAIYRPYYKPVRHPSHWLVGLLRAPCGHSMVNSNGYFICNGYAHGRCLERNSIKAGDLEKRVLQTIRADLAKPAAVSVERLEPQNAETEIESEISALEERLNRTKDAYERGIDSIDEYAANKARLTAEIDRLRSKKQPHEIQGCPQTVLLQMEQLLDDKNDRHTIAVKFIREIIWDKAAQEVTIKYFVK